jgi:hypothetical protein
MLVPLYGFLRGDSMGLLLLVHDHDTLRDVAHKLERAACVRVAPSARATVYHQGRLLRDDLTVAQAGLAPLDRVDVVPETAP